MTRFLIARRLVLLLLLLPFFQARADAPTAAVYKAKCASCHAADGSGNTTAGKSMKVRDLSLKEVQSLSNAELTKVIADGKGKMPGYAKKLSSEQIKALVGFIREMAPK